MIKLQGQKMDGIRPEKLSQKDINLSFWGRADVHQELQFDSDEDSDETNTLLFYLLNTPIQEIIVIRRENKLYNAWVYFDALNCLISSYYYAMLSCLDN